MVVSILLTFGVIEVLVLALLYRKLRSLAASVQDGAVLGEIERAERGLRDEFSRARDEAAKTSPAAREPLPAVCAM
ncbi:MAG TPA: hypothetical protein VGK99_11000 [Acidobacteriota bacterium]|jgi:hypothetical protein